jgi:polyisoprenoid-binding protein YceI
MRFSVALPIVVFLTALGCGEPSTPPADTPDTTPPALNAPEQPKQDAQSPPPPNGSASSEPDTVVPAQGTPAAPPPTAPEGFSPVTIESNTVRLVPENTTIQIIGRHAPPRGGPNDPNARTIVFEKFTGTIVMDPATKLPRTATAEIDTNSLVAFDPRLTSHLKNRDFIEVETYPTIKFESTRIEPSGEPGKVSIVGNLTLKDVTKEITIPATITNNGQSITLHGETQLNRRDFNINHSNIDGSTMPEFDFMIAVGKQTERPAGRRRGG